MFSELIQLYDLVQLEFVSRGRGWVGRWVVEESRRGWLGGDGWRSRGVYAEGYILLYADLQRNSLLNQVWNIFKFGSCPSERHAEPAPLSYHSIPIYRNAATFGLWSQEMRIVLKHMQKKNIRFF